jgi:hypothetical protein
VVGASLRPDGVLLARACAVCMTFCACAATVPVNKQAIIVYLFFLLWWLANGLGMLIIWFYSII